MAPFPRILAALCLLGCGSATPPLASDAAPPAPDAPIDVAVAIDGAPLPIFPDANLPSPIGDDARPGPDGPGDEQPTGITSGKAQAKFCHDLNRGGQPVFLTLELGEPTLVRIFARTGACAPPRGIPCIVIPVGRVPVRVLEDDRVLASRTVILTDGGEYIFQPVITNASVAITGGRISPPDTCSMVDFPPADAGPPPDGANRD